MPSLAEVQSRVRQAVVTGEAAGVAALLVSGGDVTTRVRIHHRHYHASLIEALLGKFPATTWLVGGAFMAEAVEAFLARHPPRVLCIAEYGDTFPAFLAGHPPASRLPYLRAFADLEWHLGQVSLAVDTRALDVDALARMDGATLADATAVLQPGVRYFEARWPVDTLMGLFLTETAPDQLVLAPESVWLEIRGARGQFSMRRLDQATFWFRQALGSGRSFGEAAGIALDARDTFEPGTALGQLVADGLLSGITTSTQKESV